MSRPQSPLEDFFTGRMKAGEEAEYARARQSDPAMRREYDQLFEVLRGLDESMEVSPLELELVETRLFSAQTATAPVEAGERKNLTWLWAGALALLAAGLLVVLRPELDGPALDEGSDGIAYAPPNTHLGVGHGFVARGGRPGSQLAVEFFCASPARPILDGRCPIDQELSFAFKVEGARSPGNDAGLSLFGIDERGELMYYFPTPVDAELPFSRTENWTAVEHSVRLDVNHAPGRVRMFALWSPQTPTTADIEAFHQALRERELADDEAWTDALPTDLRTRICGTTDTCRSARGELTISEKDR